VGFSDTAGDAAQHAFLYSGGTLTDLGTFGGTNSYPGAINNSGQVVGSAQTVAKTYHAFLYSGGTLGDLGTLGGASSEAAAINDARQVVGRSQTASEAYHAFLFSSGIMIDLGTFGGTESAAVGMNGSGQVVGWADTPGDIVSHAFLYSGGDLADLNALFPSDSGWELQQAFFINDRGQVAGLGVIGGQAHAFLLDPGVTTATTTTTLSVTSTTPTTATSTSTTIACVAARCRLDAALRTGACAHETVPSAISRKFATAANLIDRAAGSEPKKARRLLLRTSHLLAQAAHAATKATHGRRPKLSGSCGASLRTAADGVRQGLGV